MSEANKQIARRFFDDLYSQGRLELIDEIIADNYVAHGPGSDTNVIESERVYAKGRKAVRESLLAKPSDIAVTIEEQLAEDDTVVSRLRFSSGGKEWAGVAIQRIKDGKLVETWRIANST